MLVRQKQAEKVASDMALAAEKARVRADKVARRQRQREDNAANEAAMKAEGRRCGACAECAGF